MDEKVNIFAEKEFPAEQEAVEEILGWVEEQTMQYLDMPAAMHLQLATEEAVVNVVNYAYDGIESEKRIVKLKIGEEAACFFLELVDYGAPFNPLKDIHANPSLTLEERVDGGGWGRALILKVTDQASYVYRNHKNVLRLEKNKE